MASLSPAAHAGPSSTRLLGNPFWWSTRRVRTGAAGRAGPHPPDPAGRPGRSLKVILSRCSDHSGPSLMRMCDPCSPPRWHNIPATFGGTSVICSRLEHMISDGERSAREWSVNYATSGPSTGTMETMTSISIPDDLAERLAGEAEARGVTVDEVVAEILAERMPADDSATTLAALVGLGESGETDVSARIDEVIAQRFTA